LSYTTGLLKSEKTFLHLSASPFEKGGLRRDFYPPEQDSLIGRPYSTFGVGRSMFDVQKCPSRV